MRSQMCHAEIAHPLRSLINVLSITLLCQEVESRRTHNKGVCCAQVTCFSDSEEDAVGKSKVVPFMLETRLRELGGLYEKVQPDLRDACCSVLPCASQLD